LKKSIKKKPRPSFVLEFGCWGVRNKKMVLVKEKLKLVIKEAT